LLIEYEIKGGTKNETFNLLTGTITRNNRRVVEADTTNYFSLGEI